MKTQESLAVKEPAEVRDHTTAVVLINQVGSSSRQDTGRDAQDIADRFGIMAVAVDRPTSHSLRQDRKLVALLAESPVTAMFEVAATVDRAITKEGVKRVIIAGRSAGGLGALELALTEGISDMRFVYTAEPASCYRVPAHIGIQRYGEYGKRQRAALSDDARLSDSELVHPMHDAKALPPLTQAARYAAWLPQFLADKRYNREHWNRCLVPAYVAELSHGMRIPVHVDFAETSLVLPADTAAYADVQSCLYRIRQNSDGRFSSEVVPHTVHASFDNRQFMAHRLSDMALEHAGLELSEGATA